MEDAKQPVEKWAQKYSRKELDRAYELFNSGSVFLKREGSICKATILDDGIEYTLNLKIEDNRVKEITHESKDKHVREHVAAILIAITNKNEYKNSDKIDRETAKRLDKVIGELPDKKVRALLYQVAKRDQNLRDQILFDPESGNVEDKYNELEREISNINEQIKTILNNYQEMFSNEAKKEMSESFYDSFYNSNFANEESYLEDIHEKIDDRIKILDHKAERILRHLLFNFVYQEDYEQAQELADKVLVGVNEAGESSLKKSFKPIIETLHDFWRSFLKIIDEGSLKQNILEDFKEKFIDQEIKRDPQSDLANRVLQDELSKEDFLKLEIYQIDKRLEIQDVPDSQLVVKRLNMMRESGATEEEIAAFERPYRDNPKVLDFEIKYYIDIENWEKAEQALNAINILWNKGDSYFKERILVYEKLDDKETLKDTLLDYLYSEYSHSLDYIRKLKFLTTEEEWNNLFKDFRDNLGDELYMDLLVEEEKQEELYNMLIKGTNVKDTTKYESFLMDNYGDQLKEHRLSVLNEAMFYARTRSAYREMITEIEKLQIYPNGEEEIARLALSWYEKYPNRKAMKEEFIKAGYGEHNLRAFLESHRVKDSHK